ncbi:MAG: polysaccharide deacetylase [Gammaproteobacteria bacterium]|nr:polysaccharide deacetylase [Gammaproteobacteria bacterium]
MLKVFLTIDVELWPRNWDLGADAFQEAWRRYIQGATRRGDYGVPFQLEVLRQHQLQAVFLVEGLFAWQYGVGPLRDIVGMIQNAGQEVQLHLHPEWVHKSRNPILPGRHGMNMRDYSEDEQDYLLSLGLGYMREAGANEICAFRAGSYGADRATLRALAKHGIRYDTSYSAPYLATTCGLSSDTLLVQPRQMEGVWEFPVNCFEEFPRRLRHMQLGACSLSELIHLLLQAWRKGWHAVTIVSHGHELLNGARTEYDPIVVRRFEGLCRFLTEHRDKFETAGFSTLQSSEIVLTDESQPLTSNPWRTAWRYGEQFAMRLR